MHKKILLGVLAAAALAMAMPGMASATTGTTVPTLPSGVDPACITDADGNCEEATIALAGQLVLHGQTGLNITCNNTASVTFHEDGSSDVTAFNPANPCSTNVPGCSADINALNLDWGNQLGYNTSGGVFEDYINVDFSVQLTSGCPVVTTITESGVLHPTIAVGGGVATATFNGASSGTVSGALGTANVTGTLTSTSGVGADTGIAIIP